jgi:hypothetical protein
MQWRAATEEPTVLSSVAEIIRDLLIFVVAMTALLIVLLVVVSRLPDTNPLKRLLTALSYRLGATVAAGAVAIPIEPIPGVDALYDIGVPIALIWYWYTFFRDAYRTHTARARSDQQQPMRTVEEAPRVNSTRSPSSSPGLFRRSQ